MASVKNDTSLFTDSTRLYAEIIIPLALPLNYTWSVERFRESLKQGCRVEVNLGKSKKYAGVVKEIHSRVPEFFEPKEVLNILDVQPVIYNQQLHLWEWIARYYMCSEGEVMAAALPAHFKLSSETILVFNEEAGDDFTELDNEEYLVAEALLLKRAETHRYSRSWTLHVYPVINRLIQNVSAMCGSIERNLFTQKETYTT